MCGICGVISLSPNLRAQPEHLEAMTSAMAHRGPDDAGVWISPDGRVGLGHRRLSIIDLSPAGHQPMAGPRDELWVTFNGEIYNYRELRPDLEARGYPFRSHSDTEVLLALYERHGPGMLPHLDGDYGFGIWDQRRRELFLARDPAGVKPVYYVRAGGYFLFASEIKALLRHPAAPREIDPVALYHYLTYLVTPAPDTLFAGIKKLPAGGLLRLRFPLGPEGEAEIAVSRHYEPLPGRLEIRPRELDEQLTELFTRSIDKRLVSDVPVGVLFSGGVDSTVNTGFFQERILPSRCRTYCVGMQDNDGSVDESAWARHMAKVLGTEHHEVIIGPGDLLDTARKLAWLQDEPISDPVCVPLHFVTRLAREDGAVVLHAGEGADELFCGYANYRLFLKLHRCLLRPLSHLPAGASGLAARLLRRGGVRMVKAASVVERAGRGQPFFLSGAVCYDEAGKAEILAPAYRESCRALDSAEVVAPLFRRLLDHSPNATPLQLMTFVELQLRLPELLLMRMDKMAMGNAIEARVPFLDRRLVDFAMSVPDDFKLRHGMSKEPIKRLATRFAPRQDVYKPKRGFGAPIQQWLAGPLGRDMREMLQEDAPAIRDILNVPVLLSRLAHPPTTGNDAFRLWVIYNLLQWRRVYFTEPRR